MEIGKIYDVVFATGRYEVEYENCVRCIKITPKSYRVERADGTSRLVGQGSVLELKEVARISNPRDQPVRIVPSVPESSRPRGPSPRFTDDEHGENQ